MVIGGGGKGLGWNSCKHTGEQDINLKRREHVNTSVIGQWEWEAGARTVSISHHLVTSEGQ